MTRKLWVRWGWAAVLAIALSGCWVGQRKAPGPPPPADEDRLDWAADEPYFVVVRTACRTLDVYRYGDRIASYAAVFGLGGTSGKLHEGDRKTPTGLYTIVDVRHHPRWQRFLLLDYPNLHDLHRYEVAVGAGNIPLLGDRLAEVGGAVGIHGTDKPELNARNVDWTWGCISLRNDDVEELSTIVPVGTPVLIDEE